MALVKIKFKNGTIKEVAEHLAYSSNLQKAQGFVVIGENGEEITTPEPKQEKKNQDVEVAEVEIVPPVQSVVEIVSPLDETKEEQKVYELVEIPNDKPKLVVDEATPNNEYLLKSVEDAEKEITQENQPKKRGRKPKQ